MKFIEFAFRLGVVFAIFGFIWGVLQLIFSLLRGIKPKSNMEEYTLKFLQYFFLVDVTFLFCLEKGAENVLLLDQVILAGLILTLYFIGKFQNRQTKNNLFKFAGDKMAMINGSFNLTAEISAILFSIIVFVGFIFYPNYANNPISNWFYENILAIEKTFFFGTIFQIIGFFVLLSILFKIVNGFVYLISGKPFMSVQSQFIDKNSKKDNFDDYEELEN